MITGIGETYSPLYILDSATLANPLSVNGSAGNSNSYRRTLLHESQLNYRKVFGEKHAFDVLAVFATQNNIAQANGQTGRGFANDFTQNNSIGSAISQSISSTKSESSLDSYLGRISYAYNNKYFVDVTGRVDGSSVFGENRKYGFFPAVSAAWRVIEEPFIRGLTFINDLKLRATYGITGNAGAIGPYGSLATVAAPAIVQAGGGYYYFDHILQQGVNPTKIPNEDLRWEKSAQLDIGLDIALFNNRVDIVADYYFKRTDDLLFTKPTPLSSGYGSIVGNFASLENKGLELAVNTKIIATPKLRWDVSANITFNRNKVLNLDGIQDEIALTAYSILKKGYPLGVYKTYVADGINQVGDVILPGYDGRLGGYKVKDINPDGKIDKLDQQVTGNAQPDYFFGLSTSVKYSRFDIGGFIQGVQGSQMYNAFRYSFETPVGSQNVLAGLANRWSPTNPTNEYVKGLQGSRLPVTNRWVEDNSYIRLKNVTIGYTVTNYKFIRSLRVYLSGNNLLTITHYQGWDPESNSINGSKSNNLFIDNGTYPAAKSYVFGVQANF
jgi:TonB-linked SusC/RagA family outer membrane protein